MSGQTLHAGCVLIAETGILIRGPAGSGKSTLARELIAAAEQAGLAARLVSDDRTHLSCRSGRLIARPVPPLAGLIELRGLGLVEYAHEPAAIVRLVVDCGQEPARMPEKAEMETVLLRVRLPRLAIAHGGGRAGFVLARINFRA